MRLQLPLSEVSIFLWGAAEVASYSEPVRIEPARVPSTW